MSALEGILVVALEEAVATRLCTARLAEAGARVIKIERAEGDFAREYDHVAHGESAYFAWLSRGKQSIVLDIKQPSNAALLLRMLAQADVFVQNLAPGAAARSGFGSETLRARHPRLITVDISGYGESGPAAAMKAYDLLIQCEAGLAEITGAPDAPGRVGVSVADIACGMNAHGALLQELFERERTGSGRGIAVSLFDGIADWMAVPLLHHDYGGAAPRRAGLAHPSIAPHGAFATLDGRVIVIAIQNEREWEIFCEVVLAQPKLACDPRFVGNAQRVGNRAELDGMIAAFFAGRDADTLLNLLATARVAYASVNEVADLSRHPQLRRVTAGSSTGPVALPAPPVRWDGTPAAPGVIPALDEHGPAIRVEFA